VTSPVETVPNCAGAPNAAAKAVRYVNPDSMFDAASYSKAVMLPPGAQLVLISGTIPVDRQYAVQGDDIKDQTKTALVNLCRVMEATGVTKRDVVKLGVTYVHRDPTDPFRIAEELTDFFGRDEMPATTMAGVSFIVADKIRVQVEATAVLDK
jgi:enamine deaminase RidA (YjgF/YER057c/UK114 family)